MNPQFIHPTHTCFNDALDLLCAAIKAKPELVRTNEMLLVHGICVAPDGTEYSHAWLEANGHVFTVGILEGKRFEYAVERDEYYSEVNVIETTKYTPREAWEENRKHLTFGPWIEKYKKLTGSKKFYSVTR